jgi:hypothetical protein
MNSTRHLLHICCLDFNLKKNSCLQTLRRFYRVQVSEGISCRFYFFKNQVWPLLLIRPWTLNLHNMTFHSNTLASCKPIYLISIEFQSIDSDLSTLLKNFFFSFYCYNLAIQVVVVQFWSSSCIQISIYLKLNIHQNGPHILGVNQIWSIGLCACYMNRHRMWAMITSLSLNFLLLPPILNDKEKFINIGILTLYYLKGLEQN